MRLADRKIEYKMVWDKEKHRWIAVAVEKKSDFELKLP